MACLYPPVIKSSLNLVLKVMRRAPLEKSVGVGGMARALAWTTLGWLFYGVHAWLLIREFAQHEGGRGGGWDVFALSLGGYALAWSVGFLIIFFPGGIGPREWALIAVLAPVMSSASALVVALVSRVVMSVGDLVWAGVGLAIGRAHSRSAKARGGPADETADPDPRPPLQPASLSGPAKPSDSPPSTAQDQ